MFKKPVSRSGRVYEIPVVVGTLAASQDVYSIGMGAPVTEISERWQRTFANPIKPRLVNEAACQEVVIEGEGLRGETHGLDALPIRVSTPEFDSAPTLTATNCITKDPETGTAKPVIPSYISQVTPSESRVIKRVTYKPFFLSHLRDQLNIKGVKRVSLHEPLTSLLWVTIATLEKGLPRTEIWRPCTAHELPRAIAAKSSLLSTRTFIPITPMPSSGRWRTGRIRLRTSRSCRTVGKATFDQQLDTFQTVLINLA